MHSEQEWQERAEEGVDLAAEKYQWFMTKEPREELGPIEEIDDPYLGRTKVREVRIGMVRNAAAENRKEVLAYLSPYPHMRINDAKKLQGWYQSKNNIDVDTGRPHRPRPCFTDAILTEPYGGWCLPAGSLVESPSGPIPIEDILPGTIVFGQKGGKLVDALVLGWIQRESASGLVEIQTGDGDTLRLTAEHPVYSLTQEKYVQAGSLCIGEEIETRSVQDMRASRASRSFRKSPSVLSATPLFHRAYAGAPVPSGRPRSDHLALSQGRVSGSLCQPDFQLVCDPSGVGTDQPWAGEERENLSNSQRGASPAGSTREVAQGADGEEAFSGNQAQVCRASQDRGHWPEAVQEMSLHLSERSHLSAALLLGATSSAVAGPDGLQLGLRAGGSPARPGRCLPARLPTGGWLVHRGERLPGREGPLQDSPCQEEGLHRAPLRQGAVGEPRAATVTQITKLPAPVTVYDIQTTTENFYVRGFKGVQSFHVHNCAVGCQFCYINSGMRGYRGTGLISVPLNYGDQIKRQLASMRRSAAGYFSSFTDPFTPLEAYYHNTQQAAQAFVDLGLPIFFLSRLRYPTWAIELMTQNPHSYAQKSLNTSNPEDWHNLSPGALGYREHLADITRIKRRGVYVSIQVNPIIPGVTSHGDIQKLFKDLKQAGADHVIVKFVEAAYSWAPAMAERMIKRFGARGERFAELFTQNIGSERTVEESYRLNAHDLYSGWAKRFGLTYATCYEYEYRRDADGKIIDKTGVSIGRKYTTAAQCHGHAVPIYTRNSAEEMFRPVEECPPSGCLYCGEENTEDPGKARCGDELMGQANALKMADFKQPIGKGVPHKVHPSQQSQVVQLGLRKIGGADAEGTD